MNYLADHSTYLGLSKGMKQILIEHGLWWDRLKKQCKKPDCDPDVTDCCVKWIYETIEAAGHLCIMLPQYCCELNFIWGKWKHTIESTVIILILVFRRIFPRPWLLLMYWPFGNGSTKWSDGWMLTEGGKGPKRLRYRSRSLDHTNSHPIIKLQRLLLKYLIRLDYKLLYGEVTATKPCHRQISMSLNFINSVIFEAIKIPFCGSLHIIKRMLSARGIRKRSRITTFILGAQR